jgi:Bacterial regulatory helix-turn-helix protein, lysR family
MDRIAGMEAFVAVVEAGGFQTAARQLGISRALVSKRLPGSPKKAMIASPIYLSIVAP